MEPPIYVLYIHTRMELEVGLCQIRPSPGDVESNTDRLLSLLESDGADVLLTPELFLTCYGCGLPGQEVLENAIGRLSDACRDHDRAIALGAPRYVDGMPRNSLAFLSPDGDVWYDKMHLARFGVYAETGYDEGDGPVMGSYHGVLFGMCVCYDIFFPEILHGCSLRGSAVNICTAASAVQSKPFLDRVLPARALEDVTYTAYINNVGPMAGLEMHGCSRGLDPFGDVIADCGTRECVEHMHVDTDRLREMREVRRHLHDFRTDVEWF